MCVCVCVYAQQPTNEGRAGERTGVSMAGKVSGE